MCKLAYLRDISKVLESRRKQTLTDDHGHQHAANFIENPEAFISSAVKSFKEKYEGRLDERLCDDSAADLLRSVIKLKQLVKTTDV